MGLLDRERITGRSDGIDLLRILLALWVVITHLAEWGPLSPTGTAGWLQQVNWKTGEWFQAHGETHPAVVAFIVLSGYCIHRNGARRDSWDVRRYAIKRWFRIVPVYAAASLLGVVLFLAASSHDPEAAHVASGTIAITARGLLLKLSALTAIVPIGHMATNGVNAYEGNGPLYTVAAEMWLYVVYAGAITLLIRRHLAGRGLAVAVGVLWLFGLALVAADPTLQAWWFNASFISFLPLWWIGANSVDRPNDLRFSAAAAVVWIVCTAYLRRHGSLVVEEARLLAFGTVIAQIVVLIDSVELGLPRDGAVHPKRHLTRLAAKGNPLRAGYSLYAFHAPVLILLVAFGVAWPIVWVAAIEPSLTLRGSVPSAQACWLSC